MLELFLINKVGLKIPLPFINRKKSINKKNKKYRTRLNYNNIEADLSTNNFFVLLAGTSDYDLKLIKFNGPKIWNTIPTGIRSSLSDLKSSLRII